LFECTCCSIRRCGAAPDDAELAAFYDAGYFDRFAAEWSAREAYHAMQQDRAARLLRMGSRFFRTGRLLDVGCGLGDLLVVGRRLGWIVDGLDTGAEAVAIVSRRTATVHHQRLEDCTLPQGEFDLVTCLDVFEHLRDPQQALRTMHGLVKPGGGLLLTTVNVRSSAARLLGPQWWHYHRDHLWYFHPAALHRLARNAGWNVLKCGTPWKTFQLDYVRAVLETTHPSSYSARLVRMLRRWLPGPLRRARILLPEGMLLVAMRPNGG
jgi:2-polyprenyl-3-methyl-5-hydroxy-6-metoxy-1,4-benzoquinol methylase